MVFGVCVCHHSPISHINTLLYTMYVAENERAAEALRALGSEFGNLIDVS